MWEDYDGYSFREDALKKLKNAIEEDAKKCNIEIRLLGGLLKFIPIGIYSEVLLELEQPHSKNNTVIIYKHRNEQLTSEHKGKAVSKKWVFGFLKHHANEAKQLIAEKEKGDDLAERSKAEEKPPTLKSPPALHTPKEETIYG